MMNAAAIRFKLIAACDEAGGQAAWVKKHGVVQSDTSKMCTGRLKPMGKTIAALGYRRVVLETYVPIDEPFTPPRGCDEIEQPNRVGRPPRIDSESGSQ
jgi:hypothetical protein